jgi:hypothetical protein
MKRLLSILGLTLAFGSAFGQTPRVVDADKITRTSSTRNFIRNPDGQYDAQFVTVSNATATRSTTTPLGEAGTEWNVTITSANGTVDFTAAGATTANLGSAFCEAGVEVRGFQATSKLQVVDGSTVLGEVLIGAQTTRRSVSIPFQCPTDPSALKVRLTDTATLAATNEVSGVYLGKARNVQNVSQAEHVGTLNYAAATNCQWTNAFTATAPGSFAADTDCATPTVTGSLTAPATKIPGFTFTAKPGRYQISVAGQVIATRAAAGENICVRLTDGTNTSNIQCLYSEVAGATNIAIGSGLIFGELEYSSTQTVTVQLQAGNNGSSAQVDARSLPLRFTVYRVPNATQLAVTPSAQNVWGGAKFAGTGFVTAYTGATKAIPNNASFASPTLFGSAQVASSTCGVSSNDLAVCIPSLPAGTYRVLVNLSARVTQATSDTSCFYEVTLGGQVVTGAELRAVASGEISNAMTLSGIVTIPASLTNASSAVRYKRELGGGSCGIVVDTSERFPTIEFSSMQMNAQPVFVQSPVRAAQTGTAPLTGEVGEPVSFTSRTVTTSASSTWTANSTPLITLSPGAWLVYGTYAFAASTFTANAVAAQISTNLNNDVTGAVAYAQTVSAQNASASNGFELPLAQRSIVFVPSGTTQSLYAKAFTEDSTHSVVFSGFAIRLFDR